MAEYEVSARYETSDNGYITVNYDVIDVESMVPISRGDITDAVAQAIADALETLLVAETVDDLSVTAKRYFAATENIALA